MLLSNLAVRKIPSNATHCTGRTHRATPQPPQPRRGNHAREKTTPRGAGRGGSTWLVFEVFRPNYLVATAGMDRLAPATHLSPSLMPTMVRPAPAVKIAYSLSEPALERFGNESIL